jgi:hypothetical protein
MRSKPSHIYSILGRLAKVCFVYKRVARQFGLAVKKRNMTIKGKIQLSLLEYTDCELNVKYGKINEVRIPNVSPLILNSLGIKQTYDYTFERHYDPKKAPYKSNYYIMYYGGSEKLVTIFLKLNIWQFISLKFAMRKWIIQSEDMKKDVLKYIIGGFLGYFGAFIIQEIKEYKTAPVSPPKTESQKSLEHK